MTIPSTSKLAPASNGSILRVWAIAIALVFLSATVIAARFSYVQLPEQRAFLPICVTFWSTAEFLTAFLLYLQSYVTGTRFYAVAASAYAFTSILSIPYLVLFPGVFGIAETPAQQQISVALWLAWHLVFPGAIIVGQVLDPKMRPRFVPRAQARRQLAVYVATTLLTCCAITGAVFAFAEHLPTFVRAGHFTSAYSYVGAPLIVLANAVACVVLVSRFRATSTSPLQVWLMIALFAQLLDGLLNALSPARYSLPWYAGKGLTLMTASVVLVMLLWEVAAIYLRVAELSTVDALTGLRNRRALEDSVRAGLHLAKRRGLALSLLVIDIDRFKSFNDRYGHTAGDDCLRKVASVLRTAAVRSYDVVARYGGEEFVVVLPGSDRDAAGKVAERIRKQIELLHILHDGAPQNVVTVSIGAATVDAGQHPETLDARTLFDAADAALYNAKDSGRNTVVQSRDPIALVMPPFPIA